jgi:hypothetical protein
LNAKLARRSILPAIPVPLVKAPARVIVKLLEESNPHGLDPVLVPTDRLLERWAVSQGSDEYLTGWDEVPARSRPTPLPDDLAIVVDQAILHSTVQARNFVQRWYMRPGESVTVLAKALGLHRDTVHMRWRSTLWYMRRRFIEANLDV